MRSRAFIWIFAFFAGIFLRGSIPSHEKGRIHGILTSKAEAWVEVKDDKGYAAELQTNSEDPAASEYLWEVTSTSVDNNMVYIDATIAAYNLNFELSIDEDDISGSMMGMFDVEGIRVK